MSDGVCMAVIARQVGYRADTIKRGVVVAKLFGYEGCRS